MVYIIFVNKKVCGAECVVCNPHNIGFLYSLETWVLDHNWINAANNSAVFVIMHPVITYFHYHHHDFDLILASVFGAAYKMLTWSIKRYSIIGNANNFLDNWSSEMVTTQGHSIIAACQWAVYHGFVMELVTDILALLAINASSRSKFILGYFLWWTSCICDLKYDQSFVVHVFQDLHINTKTPQGSVLLYLHILNKLVMVGYFVPEY